jgi:hypothetical protein
MYFGKATLSIDVKVADVKVPQSEAPVSLDKAEVICSATIGSNRWVVLAAP